MECKICGHERPVSAFSRRLIDGTGQVIRVCKFCDSLDPKNVAREVVNLLDVDVDVDLRLR